MPIWRCAQEKSNVSPVVAIYIYRGWPSLVVPQNARAVVVARALFALCLAARVCRGGAGEPTPAWLLLEAHARQLEAA